MDAYQGNEEEGGKTYRMGKETEVGLKEDNTAKRAAWRNKINSCRPYTKYVPANPHDGR